MGIRVSKSMGLIIAVSVLAIFLYFNTKKYNYNKTLYERVIHSRVSKVEYRNRGGYVCYFDSDSSWFYESSFDNNDRLVSLDTSILRKDDLILKDAHSWVLSVYRRGADGKYKSYVKLYGSKK